MANDELKIVDSWELHEDVDDSSINEENARKHMKEMFDKYAIKEADTIVLVEGLDEINSATGISVGDCRDLVIPKSVKRIVHHLCERLENVYYNGTIEDWCNIEFLNSFVLCNERKCGFINQGTNFYLLDEFGDIEFKGNKYKSVNNLYFPKTIKKVSNGAFFNFRCIKNVFYDGNIDDWMKIKFGEYIKDDEVTKYVLRTFKNDVKFDESKATYKFFNSHKEENSVPFYLLNNTYESTPINYGNLYLLDEFGDTLFNGKKYSKVNDININEGIEEIGISTFYGLTITNLKLPKSLKIVSNLAFDKTHINNIYYDGTISDYLRIDFKSHLMESHNLFLNFDYNTKEFENENNTLFYILDKNGDVLYNGKKYKLLTDLIIPKEIANINSMAFLGFSQLKSVTFHNDIKVIDDGAFMDCINIHELTLPKNLEVIGNSAFANTPINELVIEENVRKIDSYAFAHCFNLESITILNKTCEIEDNSFMHDCFLKINISDEVCDQYYIITMLYSSGLSTYRRHPEISPLVEYDNACYIGSANNNYKFLIYPKDITIDNVKIHEDCEYITTIGFRDCLNLKSVVIPKNVKEVGSYSFSDCTNLKEIIFLSDETMLGKEVFYKCENLEIISIPKSNTILKESLFKGCKSLKEVTIGNIELIEDSVFEGCELLDINIPTTVRKVGSKAFLNTSISNVDFLKNVIELGESSFKNCKNIKEVNLSNELTVIPDECFFDCNSLKVLKLPTNLQVIGEYAFKNIGISNLDLPKSLTEIKNGAFSTNTKIKKVVIPENIREISSHIFDNCLKLEEVVIEGNVEVINGYAFLNCKSLKKINLPHGLKKIYRSVFESCESLKTITIPNTVYKIGSSLFEDCINLEMPKLPDNLNYFGSDVFYRCNKIKPTIYNNCMYYGDKSNPYKILEKVIETDYALDQLMEIHRDCQIIVNRAFDSYKSYAINYLKMHRDIRFVGEFAFYNLECLKQVYYDGTKDDYNRIKFENSDANPLNANNGNVELVLVKDNKVC